MKQFPVWRKALFLNILPGNLLLAVGVAIIIARAMDTFLCIEFFCLCCCGEYMYFVLAFQLF